MVGGAGSEDATALDPGVGRYQAPNNDLHAQGYRISGKGWAEGQSNDWWYFS